MSTMQRSRFVSVDAIRILGVAMVVLAHVWDSGSAPTYLYSWPVPLYFILSGYFWVDDRPLAVEWKHRYRSLVKPYVTWLAIIGVVYVVTIVIKDEFSFKAVAAPIWGGYYAVRPFTTFWFISALFFTCLLYRLICHLSPTNQALLAAAGLLTGYVLGDLLTRTPLAAGAALPCMALLMLGRVARTYKHLLGGAAGGVLLLGLSVPFEALEITKGIDIKNGHFGTPVASFLVCAATSIGLLLVAEAAVKNLRPKVATAISQLAKPGIVVVCIHPFFLYFADVPSIPVAAQLAIVLMLSWATGLTALYSPAATWLTGNQRERASGRAIRSASLT